MKSKKLIIVIFVLLMTLLLPTMGITTANSIEYSNILQTPQKTNDEWKNSSEKSEYFNYEINFKEDVSNGETSYSNNTSPMNFYIMRDTSGNEVYLNEDKSKIKSENKKYFNDDSSEYNGVNGVGGNEQLYTKYMNIIFPPNVDHIDWKNTEIKFSVNDYYTYQPPTGKETNGKKDVDGNENNQVTGLKISSSIDDPNKPISDDGNDPTTTNNNESPKYEDYVYYCKYGTNSTRKRNIKFRATYNDNPSGTSDYISIWSNGSHASGTNAMTEPLNGHTHPSDTNDINKDRISTTVDSSIDRDYFIPLTIKTTFYYDSYDISDNSIDESLFMKEVGNSVITNNVVSDDGEERFFSTYYGLDEKGNLIQNEPTSSLLPYHEDPNDPNSPLITPPNYWKIDFHFNGFDYNDLASFLFYEKDDKDGKTLFEKSVSEYGNNKWCNQDYVDFVFDNNDSLRYPGEAEEFTNVIIGENGNSVDMSLDSSAASFSLKRNVDYINSQDNLYFGSGLNNDEYHGIYNLNEDKQIAFNIPFYKWEFKIVPTVRNEDNIETIFGDESFFTFEVNIDDKFFTRSNMEIDIYTNSNMEFTINEDPNIDSVKVDGNDIFSTENTWKVTTDFDDKDENSTMIQNETIVVNYKQPIIDQTTQLEVNQKVTINIHYDSNTSINNNVPSQAIENSGDNEKEIYSQVLAVSQDKNDLLSMDSDLQLVNYYEAHNDFVWKLTDDQANMTYFEDEINNILGYTFDEPGDVTWNLVPHDIYKNNNDIHFNDGFLYQVDVNDKNSNKTKFWINVQNSYQDYEHIISGEDDPNVLDNHIPSAWSLGFSNNSFTYDPENNIYKIKSHNNNDWYITNYFDTPQGEVLTEKAFKKGWSKSDLEKSQADEIKILSNNWDRLIDFNRLIIDPKELVNSTIELYEVDNIRFSELETIFNEIIISQLTNEEIQKDNTLETSDFVISYYNSSGDEISDREIITNDDEIFVRIDSTKYGKGVNDIEFSFIPEMIEPTPLWIKLITGLVISIVVVIFSLLSFGFYKREKNKRIKK